MKIDKRKGGNEERRVLIGMIVDETVLGRISSKWVDRMFKSKWANIIANWCLKYYEKYNEAPLNEIESLFERWSEKSQDKNTVELVEKFLNSLSEEYEELKEESNSDYIIDVAGKHFNRIQMERLVEDVESDLSDGDVTKAHTHLISYNQVEMGVGQGVDLLSDSEAIKEAFISKNEPLIIYPKDLGKFFGDSLERDGFIAFMGPEKRGKSFWLIDIAYRALLQRRRVAFFAVGDMSQNQIMRRFMVRVTQRPIRKGTIKYPKRIKSRKDRSIRIKREIKTFNNNLSWKKSLEACEKVMRKKVKSKESYFKLSCHPNSSLKVKEMESILRDWERVGWIPDVIVIDYADILDMSYSHLEGRDRINETWKQMRALSQKFHCLVVTATQTDSASYKKDIITMSNFSEDKRKLSHVTGAVGLNATDKEKERQIMRLNWVVLREGAFSNTKCVYVAGCLAIANPAVKSTF